MKKLILVTILSMYGVSTFASAPKVECGVGSARVGGYTAVGVSINHRPIAQRQINSLNGVPVQVNFQTGDMGEPQNILEMRAGDSVSIIHNATSGLYDLIKGNVKLSCIITK